MNVPNCTVLLLGTSLTTLAIPAHAQTPGPAPVLPESPAAVPPQSAAAPVAKQAEQPASAKDIVVTARRRSERIQDVPIAITGDQLAASV